MIGALTYGRGEVTKQTFGDFSSYRYYIQ